GLNFFNAPVVGGAAARGNKGERTGFDMHAVVRFSERDLTEILSHIAVEKFLFRPGADFMDAAVHEFDDEVFGYDIGDTILSGGGINTGCRFLLATCGYKKACGGHHGHLLHTHCAFSFLERSGSETPYAIVACRLVRRLVQES